MVEPGPVTKAALKRGFEYGNIFVWAGGNGKTNQDSSNYDGYANSPYTLAIGAIDFYGKQSYYSESGADLLAVAPSNGASNHGIVTTDLMGSYGYSLGECTFNFGGTSASAPLAAGIVALLLEVRPDFKARDVIHVIAKYATKVGSSYSSVNQRGYSHSNDFGFGLLKVAPLIAGARNFTRVPVQKSTGSTLDFIERVLVTVTFPPGTVRGQTTIKLHSPQTTSILATPHGDTNRESFTWTFSSFRHFGETLRNGDNWSVSAEPRDSIRDVKIEWLGY
jgi:hypothetical protein